MSDIKVNVDNLQSAMLKLLADYGNKANDAINLALDDEAKDLRKEVRHNVSSAGIKTGKSKKRKDYKGGWQIAKEQGARGTDYKIHNGSAPGLVHLLEKGHNVVSYGKSYGRTRAFPHVQPATEHMDDDLMKKIEKYLGKIQ